MSDETKITVEIKNYCKIKDLKYTFEGGNIYVIGGGNDQGKSTLLRALKILSTGLNPNNNNVSFGEEEGFLKGEFNLIGANKGKYVVKHDFDKEEGKFLLIDPETKPHKSNSRTNIIADIFKYNAFTIDEWFAWGITAEGRKKQAQIILNLLPEDQRKMYLDSVARVNSKNGTLYTSRTTKNVEKDTLSKIVSEYKITEDEEKKLLNEEKGKKQLEEYKKKKEASNSAEKGRLEQEQISLRNTNTELEASIGNLKTQIEKLQQDIIDNQKKIENNKKRYDDINVELAQFAGVSEADMRELDKRIKAGEEFIASVTAIKTKKENYENHNKKLQNLSHEIEEINQKMEADKALMKKILTDSKLPVGELAIVDNEAMYVTPEGEMVPFVKDNVSYSAGGMVILKLMQHLNKNLPLWLVGSAESYDDGRLEEFEKLVKANGGIMLMDRVVPEAGMPLTITCLTD